MTTVSAFPRGSLFAQLFTALAVTKGDPTGAAPYAGKRGWHAVELACKALVNPNNTSDIASALAPFHYDFDQLLRQQTITGRMQAMRRAPFGVRLLAQTVGASGAFVAEGEAIPCSAAGFDNVVTLEPTSVGSIVIFTLELARAAVAGSLALISSDAVAATVQAQDTAFLDPANSGVAGRRPASITYGATEISSGGSTIAAIDSDLESMVQALVAAEMSLSTATWICHPKTATHLALMRGTSGAPCYPTITARGGTLAGLPVLTSSACSASGSPGERFLCLAEQSEILLADDGEVSVELSTQAALQMNDAPSNAAAQVVSLWQSGMTGLKAIKTVNWRRRNDGAVAVLRNVAF